MNLTKADKVYFEQFAKDAKKNNLSLQNHYLVIQKSLRNSTGGVEFIKEKESRGIKFASQFMEKDESCLIMGGGAGGEAAWLKNDSFKNITCLDISEELLKICHQKLGIKTVCADMRATGLESQSFDTVITHRSLHHMFYPFETLEEFARLAQKKVIIINEPCHGWVKSFMKYIRKSPVISLANIYEYNFDQDDVDRYMAFNGFKVLKKIQYWELQKSKTLNNFLNFFASFWGNRFTAVYERMV